MHGGACKVNLGGETVALLQSKCLWWEAGRTLFVADVHAGKADAFRARGVPAPAQVTAHDLDRLATEVESLDAERLVVLGDLLHAREGNTRGCIDLLAAWRERLSEFEVLLIVGNHDARAGVPSSIGLEQATEGLVLGPFELRHFPREREAQGLYSLAGHLHPVVRMYGRRAAGSLRASCFWAQPSQCVLPAFGAFTGGHRITPMAGDRAFAVGPESVREVPVVAGHGGVRRRA